MSCIIGALLHANTTTKVGGHSTSAAGQQASTVIAGLQDGYGELKDGAWTPTEWAINSQTYGPAYAQAYIDLTNGDRGDNIGILGGAQRDPGQKTGITNWAAFMADFGGNLVAAPGPFYVQPPVVGPNSEIGYNNDTFYARFFYAGSTSGSIQWLFEGTGGGGSNYSYNGALFSELRAVQFVELNNNQELISYRRERVAPTAQKITTLDGAQRSFITGRGTYQISATWRWSDNGAIAFYLDEILALRAYYADPLLIYIPAGIYYNGPFIDLVMPDNEPTISMPAPGVYEVAISGRAQP